MHSFARHGHRSTPQSPARETSETKGLILKGGWRYDLHGWLFDTCCFRGQGRELRLRAAERAHIQSGEQVLDVGCGTGTLALEVARHVGASGRVVGIDPGAEQIVRARTKAARRNAPVEFQVGAIEHLAFRDQTFDVVVSTLMMHHLPASLKRQGLMEIARVLKPGGRLVIADFVRSQDRQGPARRFHAGGSRLDDLVALVRDVGFCEVETQEMPPRRFTAFPGAVFIGAVRH